MLRMGQVVASGLRVPQSVETAGTWSCEIRNTLAGITEVDVKPYNAKVYAGPKALQHYTLTQNVWQTVSFA